MCSCWSTPRPAAPRRDVPLSIAIDQLELDNGIRVVVIPEPGIDEVSVTLRLAVGAEDDPDDKPGLAHLAEHVSFENARDGEALFDYLAASSLEFNGRTTTTSTVFTERAAASRLGDMLELEAARLSRPCSEISPAAYARQREIVRNELRERADDDRTWGVIHDAVLADGHRQATASQVGAFNQSDVCSFVAANYGPTNAVLVVSGRTSATEVKSIAERTLGRIPKSAPHGSRAATLLPRRKLDADAPVDRTWVLLAWPLSDRPAETVRTKAVLAMVAAMVDAKVNGIVSTFEIGEGSARSIAIGVAPSSDITVSDARDAIRNVMTRTGEWFTSGVYEYAQSQAIYRFASSLDHGGNRDAEVADQAAAGRNVRATFDDELGALRTLGRTEASEVVNRALHPDRATVLVLHPSSRSAPATSELVTSVREDRRRPPEDPHAAHRPEDARAPAEADQEERTLANGLRVILVPRRAATTVDIRLVLPVGTSDEPRGQRGVATLAAHALSAPFDADHLRLFQSGGRIDRDVDPDHTELSIHGLAANLDMWLAGLSSTVRDGTYSSDAVHEVAASLAQETVQSRDDRVVTEAWRAALYGDDHPYRDAGLWRKADREAGDLEVLRRFRAARYVPSGAALVVVGRFDVANANHWIDYYFGDWSGTPGGRTQRAPSFRPLAFAQIRGSDQIELDLAFSLTSTDRASTLVLAEMVEEAISDVREQLAASYGLHAYVVEQRLEAMVQVSGYVDANRAAEAFTLLRDRVARLRTIDDATAALFVTARRRVVARYASRDGRPTALAGVLSHDLAIGAQTPASELAERARYLTIERLAPMLPEIDLARAAILLRGPDAAVGAAYGAIGRKPARLE